MTERARREGGAEGGALLAVCIRGRTIAVELVWCIGFATTAIIPSVTSRKSSNVERLQSYDEYGSCTPLGIPVCSSSNSGGSGGGSGGGRGAREHDQMIVC
jgi:hypothetical protein